MILAIRTAAREDVAVIQQVMRASMAALSHGFYDPRETASAVTHIAQIDTQLIDDGTYFVVTEEDGRVVACGGWSRRAKLFTGEGDSDARPLDPATEPARVRAMFVSPTHARRGIGRMILRACEEAARAEGFSTLELMATLPGEPLYLAYGFEPVERVDLHLPDGVTVGGVKMRMAI